MLLKQVKGISHAQGIVFQDHKALADGQYPKDRPTQPLYSNNRFLSLPPTSWSEPELSRFLPFGGRARIAFHI